MLKEINKINPNSISNSNQSTKGGTFPHQRRSSSRPGRSNRGPNPTQG